MDLKQQKTAVGKPQVARLKAVGKGLRIGLVLGNRVLVKPVIPYTEMDEAEIRSKIIIPEAVKEQNTPLPSVGIVVQLGEDCDDMTQRLLYEGTGVLFSKYAGTSFTIDQVEYRIFNVEEIMATFVIDEEAEIALVGGEG